MNFISNRTIKNGLLFFAIVFFTETSFAQNFLQGTVLNEKDQSPVSGAVIRMNNSFANTSTDAKGHFKIKESYQVAMKFPFLTLPSKQKTFLYLRILKTIFQFSQKYIWPMKLQSMLPVSIKNQEQLLTILPKTNLRKIIWVRTFHYCSIIYHQL